MHKFSLGAINFGPHFKELDTIFNSIQQSAEAITDAWVGKPTNYPPYNICVIDDNSYVIELAVAGFSGTDLDVEILHNVLTVRGSIEPALKDQHKFLHKGIATRSFTKHFNVQFDIEVKSTELENGMLKIYLERILPESTIPTKIVVKTKSNKQLLNERNSI